MLLQVFIVMFMLAVFLPVSHAQNAAFPTDDEVRLLVAQTERAVLQYKPLLDEEAIQVGKAGEDAVAKDREVVHALEFLMPAKRMTAVGSSARTASSGMGWIPTRPNESPGSTWRPSRSRFWTDVLTF